MVQLEFPDFFVIGCYTPNAGEKLKVRSTYKPMTSAEMRSDRTLMPSHDGTKLSRNTFELSTRRSRSFGVVGATLASNQKFCSCACEGDINCAATEKGQSPSLQSHPLLKLDVFALRPAPRQAELE